MDFGLNELQKALHSEVISLAGRFSLDWWLEHDRNGEYPWEFVRAFAERGWLGLIVPEDYGGGGLGITEASILLHAVGESGAGLSGASAIHFYVFPITPVIRHGSDAMKREVLPAVAKGDLLCAFGVTEPNAGTDTSRIETRAERIAGRWVINGQKMWTTNAQNAAKLLLLARTSPRDPAQPLDGMTLFLADLDRDACEVRKIEKLGRAAVDSNEVFIHDLEATDSQVVGEVGRGFQHLLDGLNPERIVIAAEACGIGRAALRLAGLYARDRIVFDRPIGKNQAVAHPLARSWAELEAAELLTFKAAWLYDNQQPCGVQANAAKVIAADAGFAACDSALQVHGGFGYAREFHVERLWREVRLIKLAPVTQEMALNFVAERALGLPKSY